MDLDPYSEYGSGSKQVNIEKIRGNTCMIEDINSPFRDSTDLKFLPGTLFQINK